MLRSARLLAFLLASSVTTCLLHAQSGPANLDFEEGPPPTLAGWHVPSVPGYVVVRDSVHVQHGRWSVRIGSQGEPNPQAFGNVMQRIDATAYRGEQIRFSGFVRSDLPQGTTSAAQLWLRVDRPDRAMGFFDNMGARPITGRTEWMEYEIVADVDPDAEWIAFGMLLRGEGQAWFDNFSFAVLDSSALLHRRPSREAERYLTSALDSMQLHSVRRDSIDWVQLREMAPRWAGAAQTSDETYGAIQRALRELGDNHSFFMPPQQVSALQQRGSEENPAPVVRRLDDGIGYVQLPAYGGGDRSEIDHYAAQLHGAIARVDTPAVCGWIVDLRENGGGNMWPMLAGVGPILGEGVAGMLVDPEGHRVPWSYAGGAARLASTTFADAGTSSYVPAANDRPVAVLTGSRTASSGEAVAVSFRARPNTRSFGQSTRGVSTGNRPVQLSDGAWILLTTSTFADRRGTLYGGALEPDVVIEADDPAEVGEEDPVMSTAQSWLLEQPACSSQR